MLQVNNEHMTEFSEKYKSLSNIELLKILEEQKKYQQIAVETAKKELENRKLSKQELEKIKSEILKEKLEKKKRTEKKEKITNYLTPFFETINPIQSGIKTPEKIINLITIIFGIISIYRPFKEYTILHYIFTDSNSGWDLSMVDFLLPLIILPIATYLFWKRKKTGWILMAIFLTYSAIIGLTIFFMSLNRETSGFGNFEALFPTVSPISYFLTFVFFSGSLWAISKKEIREYYNIKNTTLYKVIGISIIFMGIYLLSIFP